MIMKMMVKPHVGSYFNYDLQHISFKYLNLLKLLFFGKYEK